MVEGEWGVAVAAAPSPRPSPEGEGVEVPNEDFIKRLAAYIY